MAPYSYQGQFGQGIFNPQTGGGKNMAAQRLTPSWSGGLGGNAWLKELQGLMKGFGFDYGSLAGGGKGGMTNGLPNNVWNFVNQATAGGGGNSYKINPRLTDVTAAINAAKPAIYEEQEKGFGNAAARMGKTGMLASSPYMEALGGVARKSTNDIASLIENLTFQANESAAQRALQGDIATQGDMTARDLANRRNLMSAADLAWNVDQSGNANNLNAAQLLGDWYMRMREGDENRTLSYAGMNQGGGTGGGSGRAPSYIPAENTGASRMSSYAQQLQERDLRRQLTGANESGTTRAATSQTDPLADIRRQLEMQELTRQLNQQPTEEEQMATNLRKKQLAYDLENGPWAAAKGSAATGGPSNELFRWLNGMGFDQSMIDAIKMNPQMLEYFWSKFNNRGA